MNEQYAKALLAMANSDPTALAAACEEVSPDDAETLFNEVKTYLSEAAGTEEDVQEEVA